MSHMPPPFKISKEVQDALDNNGPVVALESTVITHGLPHPHNLELARSMERIIRENGATPATVAILDGEIRIGLDDSDLELLAQSDIAYKASRRDFGYVLANKKVGGTTVAGTIYAATQAGIKVFATGGIGGVHRGLPFDVSADLNELSISPIVVVCAGAKAILDIPSTLEYLETHGVMVLGYRIDTFPAFYCRSSRIAAPYRAESPEEVAAIASAQWGAGLNSAILVGNPIPKEYELDPYEVNAAIDAAVNEADVRGIHGAKLTPFLLQRVSHHTDEKSLKANLALLENNAKLAAEVAKELAA